MKAAMRITRHGEAINIVDFRGGSNGLTLSLTPSLALGVASALRAAVKASEYAYVHLDHEGDVVEAKLIFDRGEEKPCQDGK
ncbi:MAG: hypothetical protein DRI61_15090 [Chloroflexi bacterium]|nr:MAG: hypothetical protein DRI61_15090 [Chloroflexota bacterium]